MMNKQLSVLVAVPALMLAFSAQAHSEKEHMKTAENPDCAAMSSMDHSKMDMNDPVVMAMMQQCMSNTNSMRHGSAGAESIPHHESTSHGHRKSHGDHMSGAGKAGHHMQAPSE